MAFDPAPSSWLGAGYALTSNSARFNTATAGSNVTVPQLTDAEANATTGDIRKIFYALLEMMWQAWLAKAAADRPSKMVLQKQTVTDDATGTTTVVFSATFVTAVSAQEVVAES